MSLSTDPTPQPAKFMFGVSFDHESGPGSHDPFAHAKEERLNMTVSEFEAAKAQAYADGVNAGKAEASSTQQAQFNNLLGLISGNLQSITTYTHNAQQARDEAIATAIKAIAYKLLPSLTASAGFAEIEAVVKKILVELRDEPRLVIRVADMNVEACSTRLPELAKQIAFPGQLIILAEPQLGPADCRIEWADGGMERLENNLWAEIERLLAKYSPHGASEVSQHVQEYEQLSAEAAAATTTIDTVDTEAPAAEETPVETPQDTTIESPIEGGNDVK